MGEIRAGAGRVADGQVGAGGMTKPVEIAVTLMRMAMALLDSEGEGLAAARLQQAIDSVGRG